MGHNTLFIQNIISPYRNRFFNVLKKTELDFAVYYMALSEPDRNWDVSNYKMVYDYWVDTKGKYFRIKDFGGHLNPRLVWRVLRDKSVNNIVLAVSWTDPNIMFIALAKKLHLTKTRLFFWAEANYTAAWTNKHNTKLKWWLKRAVFNAIDGALIIPGKMSEITFEKWGIRNKEFIRLPNTIDDSNLLLDMTKRNDTSLPIFIMPIRIIERVKGGLNFFRSIGIENIRRAMFIIAGDGEDKEEYAKFILDNNLTGNIQLAGFCESKEMSDLYCRANALVLPSFSDPSPLSLIEALFFHLPILCSDHCGNHFETVKDDYNGLTFSPLDSNDIRVKYEKFLSMKERWPEMGENSRQLYDSDFETTSVIDNFVKQFDIYRK